MNDDVLVSSDGAKQKRLALIKQYWQAIQRRRVGLPSSEFDDPVIVVASSKDPIGAEFTEDRSGVVVGECSARELASRLREVNPEVAEQLDQVTGRELYLVCIAFWGITAGFVGDGGQDLVMGVPKEKAMIIPARLSQPPPPAA